MSPMPPKNCSSPAQARASRRILASLCACLAAGCGASTPPAEPPAAAASTAAVATSAPTTDAHATAAPPATASKPAEPEILARDSSPPGVARLSKEEGEEAQKACAPLADALAAAAKRKHIAGPAERSAFIEAFLQSPPKLPRVDVARCADLLLRDVRAYVAATIESEAGMNIGRIVVGLATASEREPPSQCPSAGPVPADVNALAAGPWRSKPEDWSAPGWKCARFDLSSEPQRFQYQIVTGAGTWEVIARGFPVKGAAATELYARGRLEGGHVKPSREVFRRAPTR